VKGVPTNAVDMPVMYEDEGQDQPGIVPLEAYGLPLIAVDMPVLFEDEGQAEMGDTSSHTLAMEILSIGIVVHLASQLRYQVFSNLNVYYHPVERWAYFSPDVMVVAPPNRLPDTLRSYRIGTDGPAPVLVVEILSRRSFQEQDLTSKPILYAKQGIAEYILVDTTGEFLPQRLLLKRLRANGTWADEQDPDGGVTSALGFRLVIEADDSLRVIETATGKRYLRPRQAQGAFEQAEERIRALEAELARLRGLPPSDPTT
jgi:Uma2 family endonuclease